MSPSSTSRLTSARRLARRASVPPGRLTFTVRAASSMWGAESAKRSRVCATSARSPGDQLDVLPAGDGRFNGGELTGKADQPPDGARLCPHVVTGHVERPRVRGQQRGDGAYEGRLARAVWTEHSDD